MRYKAYIITFDLQPLDNIALFHEKLTGDKDLISWWHYLDGTYIIIVGSNINATSISEFVLQLLPQKHFFVCEINLRDHNGWLPPDAWTWVNQQVKFLY